MSNSADGSRVLDPDDRLDDDTESGATGEKSRMSFLDHLDELRKRILYSVYALGAMCLVTFWFWERMFVYLARLLRSSRAGIWFSTGPMGAFMFSMKLSMLAALILAAPFVFTQVWLFVAPGSLFAREETRDPLRLLFDAHVCGRRVVRAFHRVSRDVEVLCQLQRTGRD